MTLRRVLAGVLAGSVLILCSAGDAMAGSKPEADSQKLAYFQTKTIARNGLRGTHTVALTFDDGPNDNTRKVLDALDTYNVKATFFIVGTMAKAHPDVLAEVAARGHLLGNHSATHPKLGALYVNHPNLLLRQIRQVNDVIAPLMQPGDTPFFRAPYGYWKGVHAAVLNADPVLRDYVGPIYWDIGGETTIDSEGYVRTSADWDCWNRGWTAATCAKGYLREIESKDGGVVIMHCINAKAGALVDAVVPVLQKEGFTFVRLDEIKTYDKYKTPPEKFRPSIAMADIPRRH